MSHIQTSFDVIVIGLGAHGSSALYHLSKTGKRVMGIDRYTPPHAYGSSHGQSRIIRQAYHENPLYVPLVTAAYPLWEELERESGVPLLTKTGGLLLGREDTMVVRGARISAETHGIPFEYLDCADLRRRFPAFRPSPDTVGVLEKNAGILFPELCIKAFLDLAVGNGAAVHCEETVLEIKPLAGGVEVRTSAGTYFAAKVIVSAGAWLSTLLPALRLPLTIERQVVCWFGDQRGNLDLCFGPGAMPVYIWEYLPGRLFYGFPDLSGAGLKIGFHHAGKAIEPDGLKQDVSAEEIDALAVLAGKYLGIEPVFRAASVCMYTNTPDEHFIIDFYPGNENILIASPCSGHGFKFSSLIGKVLGEMVMGDFSGFDPGAFGVGRFMSV